MPEAKLKMSCDFSHILERVEREKKNTDIFTVITSRWCYLGVVEFLKNLFPKYLMISMNYIYNGNISTLFC